LRNGLSILGEEFEGHIVKAVKRTKGRERADFCYRALAFLSNNNKGLIKEIYHYCKDTQLVSKNLLADDQKDVLKAPPWKSFIEYERGIVGSYRLKYHGEGEEHKNYCVTRRFYREAFVLENLLKIKKEGREARGAPGF
jgi:hypothetical protein